MAMVMRSSFQGNAATAMRRGINALAFVAPALCPGQSLPLGMFDGDASDDPHPGRFGINQQRRKIGRAHV